MLSAQVIELLVLHEQALSRHWLTLVIICDNGWLELSAACRACLKVCVVLSVHLVAICRDLTGLLCIETRAGMDSRAGIDTTLARNRLCDPSMKDANQLATIPWALSTFIRGKALSYESIAFHEHLSCLFFLPHSLPSYRPLICRMADKGQKQKLVEIRAREV